MTTDQPKSGTEPYAPTDVIPEPLAKAVADLPTWFVIGGQAVRCLSPYRPSRDVDFGVSSVPDLEGLLARLKQTGDVEILEQGRDTVHLRWRGFNVSIFVLDRLAAHTQDRRLNITGLLATKLHAVLDRGTRRDFFDLYVIMQQERLGVAACLQALHEVHGSAVGDAVLLRAMTYFEDAEGEAPLPGEGPKDWRAVKDFFLARVGDLLVPPGKALANGCPARIRKRSVSYAPAIRHGRESHVSSPEQPRIAVSEGRARLFS